MRRPPAPDDAEASRRSLAAPVFARAGVDGGSGSRKLDVLEREDFGELVEVRIAMEYRNAAVFGGS